MQPTSQSSHEKTILLLLSSIQFAHVVDFMIMMPLGPQLMRLFSLSPSQFGHIVSAYGISSGIAGLVVAPFIDRYDRKLFLAVCLVGLFAGTLMCGFANSANMLIVARCVAGFFGGILGGLVQAIISDVFPPQRRGYAISRVMISFSIASIFGLPIGLALANRLGWHAPFVTVSALLAILFFLAQFAFPSLKSHIDSTSTVSQRIRQLNDLLFDKRAGLGFFATLCIIMGQFMVIPYISPYLVKNLGFAETQLPLLYFLGGAASIVTMPLIGKLTDQFGAARVFPFGIFISIIPLFTLTHLETHNPVVILSITTFFMVCMGGRMVPYSSLLSHVVSPQKRGAYLSLNASVQSLAQGGAAFIASILVAENASGELVGYSTSGWLAGIFSLLTIVLGLQIAKAGASSEPQTSLKTPSQPQPTSESVDPS